MNSRNLLIGGLLTLAIVLGALTLRSLKTEAPIAAAQPPEAHEKRTGTRVPSHMDVGRPQTLATGLKANPAANEAAEAAGEPGMIVGHPSAAEATPPRERAVEVWESLVDQVVEQKDLPAVDQAQRVKAAFDTLDKADQMDGIRRALNLFPDEQFPALCSILFDKAQASDVLDAIFSDALNRPEEIKMPLLKALRKDRTHPMFFEAARILDVVEPAE